MKHWKQSFIWIMVLLMTLSLTACASTDPKAEQKAFEEFMKEEVIGTLMSDYTAVHQLIEDPSAYDIDMKEVEVNCGSRFDEKTIKAQNQEIKKTAEKFEEFDRDALTKKQQDLYDLYAFHLETSLIGADDKFNYYTPLFQSAGGLHYQIPTTFADWEVRNEQDVKDLITLMNDVKPYFDSAIDYTLKQEELGLLMLDLDAIIEYCDGILNSKDDSAILKELNTGIDQLQLVDGETYKRQLKEAFDTSFIPAYERLNTVMKELKERGKNNTNGLAQFEYGTQYYEMLFQRSIGSKQSVDTIQKELLEVLQNNMTKLQMLVLKDPSLLNALTSEEGSSGLHSYEEIMAYVEEKMKPHFPDTGKIDYEIKNVNDLLASNSGIAAYFIFPALDSNQPRQLRVNPHNDGVDSFSNYITVSHEGFPGHMYQASYAYQNTESDIDLLYLNILGRNTAFTEGWAVYAGYEALSYLDVSKDFVDAWVANEMASYAIAMLVDIGIHHDGWTYEKYEELMSQMGVNVKEEESSLKAQFNQLQANPAIFESYYVGYMEIMKLKEMMKEEKGKDFDEVEFHKSLLDIGALPFESIQARLMELIEK